VTQVTSKKAQTEVIYIRAKFSRKYTGLGGASLASTNCRALSYLKKSPGLITGHSPSIALYFAARNATSHSARVINSDAVRNLKVAVGRAIEASCIAGTRKLLRWEFADRAKEGHGKAASEAHPSPAASVCPTWKDQHDS
jgi:hypothetical protein